MNNLLTTMYASFLSCRALIMIGMRRLRSSITSLGNCWLIPYGLSSILALDLTCSLSGYYTNFATIGRVIVELFLPIRCARCSLTVSFAPGICNLSSISSSTFRTQSSSFSPFSSLNP